MREGGNPGARRDRIQGDLCFGFTNQGNTTDRRPREILLDWKAPLFLDLQRPDSSTADKQLVKRDPWPSSMNITWEPVRMQIPTEAETLGVELNSSCFHKPSRWFQPKLKFENQPLNSSWLCQECEHYLKVDCVRLPSEHLRGNLPRGRFLSWSDLLTKELTSVQYMYAYRFQYIIYHPSSWGIQYTLNKQP